MTTDEHHERPGLPAAYRDDEERARGRAAALERTDLPKARGQDAGQPAARAARPGLGLRTRVVHDGGPRGRAARRERRVRVPAVRAEDTMRAPMLSRGGTLVSYAGAAMRPELMDMTSAADGHTHAITAAEFEQGVLTGLGRYRAACGADVVVASMVAQSRSAVPALCGVSPGKRARTRSRLGWSPGSHAARVTFVPGAAREGPVLPGGRGDPCGGAAARPSGAGLPVRAHARSRRHAPPSAARRPRRARRNGHRSDPVRALRQVRTFLTRVVRRDREARVECRRTNGPRAQPQSGGCSGRRGLRGHSRQMS